MAITVTPIPTLDTNYAYLITDTVARKAVAVDPAQPARVLAAAAAAGVSVVGVLCTHHHPDHSAGNAGLVTALGGGVPVVGSALERGGAPVPGATVAVGDGATGRVEGTEIEWAAIHTPGHTDGHLCFLVPGVTVAAGAVDGAGLGAAAPTPAAGVTHPSSGGPAVVVPALFSGDALFLGGCGRLFEGTPAQMLASLDALIATLPAATAVYCGHEYTVENLRFAAAVEPASGAVAAAAGRVAATLGTAPWADPARGVSVPGWLGAEAGVNPFLRVRQPAVAAAAVAKGGGDPADPVAVMAALREWKNNF